jgi:hypothetical protein
MNRIRIIRFIVSIKLNVGLVADMIFVESQLSKKSGESANLEDWQLRLLRLLRISNVFLFDLSGSISVTP